MQENIVNADNTQHWNKDRKYRDDFINYVIGGDGREIWRGFMWNKERPWLPEVHRVFSNGIIIVVNPERGFDRIITKKLARPQQVFNAYALPSYIGWKNGEAVTVKKNATPPSDIIKKCRFYKDHYWNNDEYLPGKDKWDYWKEQFKKNA